MSKQQKKRKFQILPNSITPTEENATRNVLRRMRNQSPVSDEPVKSVAESFIAPINLSNVVTQTDEVINTTGTSDTGAINVSNETIFSTSSTIATDSVNLHGTTGITAITDTTDTTGISDTTDTTGISGTIQKTGSIPISEKHPISPIRDFTKTPNSVTRIALAQGMFVGKNKQIYDYLWSISRGSIKPNRTFRKTHKEIMKGAAIGSRNTVIRGLGLLEKTGLIKIVSSVGAQLGNEYEIFTPDEIDYTSSIDRIGITDTTGITRATGVTGISQKLVKPEQPVSGTTGISQVIENKAAYNLAKTLLKTIRQIDDETPFIRAIEKLNEASRSATGNGLTKKDLEAFESIIDLIIDITTVATKRTESVTTYLKFAEANLKKRLVTAQRIFEKKPVKPFEPGTPSTDEPQLVAESIFEPEPLTEEQRENALVIYRPLFQEKGTEALENGRWQFTTEDYKWLLEKLSNN